jgi:hypothetical protein
VLQFPIFQEHWELIGVLFPNGAAKLNKLVTATLATPINVLNHKQLKGVAVVAIIKLLKTMEQHRYILE